MKKIFFLSLLFLVACQTAHETPTKSAIVIEKEKKVPSVTITKNILKGGFKELSTKNIKILIFQDLPDSYLLKAKSKLNPPDAAISFLKSLNSERVEIFDQAVVTYCDTCPQFEAEWPVETIPEDLVIRTLHQVTLKLEPGITELNVLANYYPKSDYIWVFFISDDFEFNRRIDKNSVLSSTDNEMALRAFLFDTKARQVVLSAKVQHEDTDSFKYAIPAGISLDTLAKNITHPSLNQQFPFPPEADSLQLLKSSVYGFFEKVSTL